MLANSGFLWTQEVAQFALSIITFIGGARAFRVGQHGFVRFVLDRLAGADAAMVRDRRRPAGAAGRAVAGVASLPVIAASWGELTPILSLPAALLDLPLTVGMVLIALYALDRLARRDPRLVAAVALPLAAVVTIAVATAGSGSRGWRATVPCISAIGAAVGAAARRPAGRLRADPRDRPLSLETSGGPPLLAMPQNMVNGTSNFVLLAVPFFIFAGLIMERGGISLRLVRFVHALVGHFRGGLLQVMVGSMYLVSGLSGSKAADVAAVGSVMREMLEREGISARDGRGGAGRLGGDGRDRAAVHRHPGARLDHQPVDRRAVHRRTDPGRGDRALPDGADLRAGAARARRARRNVSGGARSAARRRSGAILPLGMPVMLFAGILLGVATPTEVSAFAVLYGLGLAIVGYREMTGRDFLRAVIDTATLTGMILLILAAASGFSWALTMASLPQRLVGAAATSCRTMPRSSSSARSCCWSWSARCSKACRR